MVRDSYDPLIDKRSLQHQLKGKSRHRRENLVRLAKLPASSHATRNDALPQLELVSIGLDELHLPVRKIRKRDLAHVREVAGSIRELGFLILS